VTNDSTAISVQDLSKVFSIYESPLDVLRELISGKARHKSFWALRDISLDIRKGESVGIVGRNGAGKSTLLRILAGTMDETSGLVRVAGRVSSILELGTGFHPEYTGRENIVMGGLCLGMTREEIENKMDWIIDFSELDDFINQPFKTYSTGMQMRLTFSTATCIPADVLIIDEALAVGDAKFQRRCFDRLNGFRAEGRTILLVSHDLNSICTFCDRAILLEQGSIQETGNPEYVARVYHKLLFGNAAKDAEISTSDPATIDASPAPSSAAATETVPVDDAAHYGDKKIEVTDLLILDDRGHAVTQLESGSRYRIRVQATLHEDLDDIHVGFLIRNPKGIDLFGVNTMSMGTTIEPGKRGAKLNAELSLTMWLTSGDYFLTISFARSDATQYDLRWNDLGFTVMGDRRLFTSSIVDLEPNLEIHYQGCGKS
jgi:ABC-type polysaccharide/polyol phosphate transport system ATPase subunit